MLRGGFAYLAVGPAYVLSVLRMFLAAGDTKKAPSQRKRRPEALVSGCLRSGSRRLAGDLGETSEGIGVADGDVGQHLAVQLDAGQ